MDCHFLVQVKRNCRRLWETMALHTALSQPISTCEYYDARHGYQVVRRVELFVNAAALPPGWTGIQRFVRVWRWGVRNHRPFQERSLYLLSKPLYSARQVAQAIQGHWSIENNLHWTKDVLLHEDNMTIRTPSKVPLLVYLNNAALNMLRTAGYRPNKDTFAKFANKVHELHKLFQANLHP